MRQGQRRIIGAQLALGGAMILGIALLAFILALLGSLG